MKTLFILASIVLLVSCGKFKNTAPTEVTDDLQQAWSDYYDAISHIETTFTDSDVFNIDDAHRAGAYHLIQSLIATNFNIMRAGDGSYPHIKIMLSPTIRLGIDNPDTFYRNAFISNPNGDRVYRVWGKRGNTADWLLELFDATSEVGAISVFEDEHLKVDEDGNYEVFVSATPQGDNWFELPQSNKILNLIVRDSFSDWAAETASTVNIELVGSGGVPSADLDESHLLKPILHATKVLLKQGKFWPSFAKKLQLLGHNNFSKFKPTGKLGIISQYFGIGYFSLEDDEALVFKLPEVNAGYCGAHISNFWASAPDWPNRQVSLSWCRNGKAQAYKADDGWYYIVVSKQDPGIQNWLDTAGLTQGLVVLRIQSPRADIDSDLKAESTVVKLSELDKHIPNDMPRWNTEQRQRQIEQRQQHTRQRYQTY